MPTYEYECNECGNKFEKFQNMSDEPLEACPECGGGVRRLIGSGGAMIVKGSSTTRSEIRPSCGRDTPCCGRDTPCDVRPCDN